MASKMLFRFMSFATLLGVLGFVYLLVLSRSMSYSTQETAFILSGGAIATGLIIMIAHLNLVSLATEPEKERWRRMLAFTGPIAAIAYLWSAASRPAVAAETPSRRVQILLAVLLASTSAVGTYFLVRNLPDRSAITDFNDLLIYRIVQAGGLLPVAVAGRLLGLSPVLRTVSVLPSAAILLGLSPDDVVARVLIASACVLIAWLIGRRT